MMVFRIILTTTVWGYFFAIGAETVGKDLDLIDSSCRQAECLRCNLGSSECVKCIHVMMMETRTCLHTCPHGFDPIWAEELPVFGRICQERSVLAMVSYREVGIIAGASVIGAICVGVFLGVLLLRKNGVKLPPDSPPRGLPRSLQDKRPKTAEIAVKGKERAEFLSRLRLLRTDAPYIFRMMAATRNRFRSGSATGHEAPSDAKTKACKAVVRDLSRVLCLLSLKEEHLQTAPKDWRGLLSWTERLLARYKRQEEIKALGDSGFVDPLKTTPGHFVTRQQQVKAEQEKRRLGGKTSLLGKENDEESKDCKPEWPEGILNPLQQEYKDFFGTNESISKTQIPNDVSQEFSAKKDLKQKSNIPALAKGNKKKLKDFLDLNKFLWSKLMFPKTTLDQDIEKGHEKDEKLKNALSIEDFNDFSPGTDDISSEIFFEHIEAFAFDIEDVSEEANSKKTEGVVEPCNDISKKTKYKNNLNLYKNYKNSCLFLDTRSKCSSIRDFSDLDDNQKPNGKIILKEKKPSKLRRLSSSILMKDKKHLSLSRRDDNSRMKKRRPLKRQKQVEKGKRSKIQQKYQNKSFREDSTIKSTENQSTVEVLNTSINPGMEDGGDVYLSVIKTPVPRRCSNRKVINVSATHYKAVVLPKSTTQSDVDVEGVENGIQQSDDSKIKIKVPSMSTNKQSESNDSRHFGDNLNNELPKNLYSKYEILTDV